MRPVVVRYRWAIVLAGMEVLATSATSEAVPAHSLLITVRFPSAGFDPQSQAVCVTVVNPSADASWAVVVFYTAAGRPLKREALTVDPRQTAVLDLKADDLCGVTGRT